MGESSPTMNKPRPKAAKGTTHKAPRAAKAAASAKMAGFEYVGQHAATAFKQLNTAAMLSLAHERAGEHIKPSAALSLAGLPTGNAQNHQLYRRLAQLREAMEAADAPPGLISDVEDESDSDDEGMTQLLSEPTHAAALAKQEQRIKDLVACMLCAPGGTDSKYGHPPGFSATQTAEQTMRTVSMDTISPSSTSSEQRPDFALRAAVRAVLPPGVGLGARDMVRELGCGSD